LPDRVVTNGPTFAGVLEREGFPRERIRVGCALRHATSAAGAPGLEPEERSCVLVAGSIDAAQTIELVTAAREAFGDDIVVKLHPLVDAARVRKSVRVRVRYEDRPIAELLRHARAMLYTYSVVPYEALMAGVPPIFFQSEVLLDLDQLDPTPDVRWTGRTPDELRAALAAAEAAAGSAEWQERARVVVREALTPITPGCLEAFL
jgi:hypothetical protein